MFILYNYYARDIKISLKIIVLILTSVVSVFFFFGLSLTQIIVNLHLQSLDLFIGRILYVLL